MTMVATDIRISNEHMNPSELAAHLTDELAEIEQRVGQAVTLELLGKQKTLGDATTKVLVKTWSGRRVAVIVCSRAVAPDLIARGTRSAAAIRSLIGPELGSAVIQPIFSGTIDGRSYELLPFCRDISTRKPFRTAQRIRLSRPLLDWLARATHAAVAAHERRLDGPMNFRSTLVHLQRQRLFGQAVQHAIRHAISRIDRGEWVPRHTFDHNDLYLRNIMLPPRTRGVVYIKAPFLLIDWAGANPVGYGVYDLVRLARALNLSAKALLRQLRKHSSALRCELVDLPGHLLAACGRLHQHLEHFPQERFVQTVEACWSTLERAMPVAVEVRY